MESSTVLQHRSQTPLGGIRHIEASVLQGVHWTSHFSCSHEEKNELIYINDTDAPLFRDKQKEKKKSKTKASVFIPLIWFVLSALIYIWIQTDDFNLYWIIRQGSHLSDGRKQGLQLRRTSCSVFYVKSNSAAVGHDNCVLPQFRCKAVHYECNEFENPICIRWKSIRLHYNR